jgi:hypothetical protein
MIPQACDDCCCNSKAKPSCPQCQDKRLVALVRLLARIAAERDYTAMLEHPDEGEHRP